MNLKNKKILVTGADGFIGSHLTEALVRNNYDVRAFVYYNAFNSWGWLDKSTTDIKKSLDVFAGDIRDGAAVKKALTGCDVVLHLAALIGIPYSYVAPDSYVDTNIKGTLNVLQAARELGISRVVHTSTSEVYGTAQFVPITEEHPINPQSPYAATKSAADSLALSFYLSFGTPVTVVRPFNTYGPRQSARAVIPTIITQIANGADTIQLGSVETTRDFNYVDDTVEGFIRAASSDKAVGKTINLGSNFEISIAQTVKLIAEIFERPVKIQSKDERVRPKESEVERLWAANQKAAELLDWTPRYGGIEGMKRGLQNTITWFSQPENLSSYKSHMYNV